MSFFNKIKQGLGIGTAKVELDVPTYIPKDAKEVAGKVTLTAKSDQKVKSIKVHLEEETVRGFGEERDETVKQISSILLNNTFEIKTDEEQTIDFTLPLNLSDGLAVNLLGIDVKLTSSSGTSSDTSYYVVATVDLEGVALDPKAREYLLINNKERGFMTW